MKSEKEKMILGEKYNPSDLTLMKERDFVKDFLFEFNSTKPSLREDREEMLRSILGNAGKNLWLESPFQCDYGYNIYVGDNFYANHNFLVLDSAPVHIGNNVFIGPNVSFYTPSHPVDASERNTLVEWAEPITVGNDVWIGGSVTVLPGVTIGDNVVIGAGSVVVKDIPSNSVAVGNPCKVIKKLD